MIDLNATGYSFSMDIAQVYAELAKRDQAFLWIRRAIDERHPQIGSLKCSPEWDPIRSDLRYIEMLAKIDLQP